jgi:hypothetical protein
MCRFQHCREVVSDSVGSDTFPVFMPLEKHMFMLSLWSSRYKSIAFFRALPKKQAKGFFYRTAHL